MTTGNKFTRFDGKKFDNGGMQQHSKEYEGNGFVY